MENVRPYVETESVLIELRSCRLYFNHASQRCILCFCFCFCFFVAVVWYRNDAPRRRNKQLSQKEYKKIYSNCNTIAKNTQIIQNRARVNNAPQEVVNSIDNSKRLWNFAAKCVLGIIAVAGIVCACVLGALAG